MVCGGTLAAIELAEFLAENGRRVSIIDSADEPAPEVGAKRRAEHMDRLARLGVVLNTRMQVDRITADAVVVRRESGSPVSVAADSVIVAGAVEPDTSLADEIGDRFDDLHVIGDCTGLGLIRKALEEGARVGCLV